jgi:FSR family fosmidomycin resistance protein-like MFS transporter
MVAGMLADASLSVTLVMAQQLVPGRVGVTSGLFLGLGFVTGGIGVPVTGRIADAVGMQAALLSLIGLVVLAVGLALTLPSDRVRFDRRLSPVAR